MPASHSIRPIMSVPASLGHGAQDASRPARARPRARRNLASHTARQLAGFPPTRDEALARMRRIDVEAYARTRKSLSGAASRLSPYVTHGLIDVPEIALYLREERGVALQDKIMFELAWREYFHHVWSRSGKDIFAPYKSPPARSYAQSMPLDVLEARTGLSAIDACVRELYATGYLHNHARLWLASYLVHLRKVDWRPAAQWMYAHLLDGDIASNWLSWQWVAGTLTGRPYVFTADNVRRHAPEFDVDGSSIDRGYEDLQLIASSPVALGPEHGASTPAITQPPVFALPPLELNPAQARVVTRGKRIALLHPWSLQTQPGADVNAGVILTSFHERFAWSRLRWQFVLQRMSEICDVIWVVDAKQLRGKLSGAAYVSARASLNPGYREVIETQVHEVLPEARLFINPQRACQAFGQFWKQICAQPPFELSTRDLADARSESFAG